MSKQNPEFITVQEAVARGYGSRAALCKCIKNGQVRTYMDDAARRRYVCAEDWKTASRPVSLAMFLL